MLATSDLNHLTRLTDQHRWRLALIGDPHQLSAVGRGGMFAELCATGRAIELDTIHRFRNEWEAAASLKLRHGDPTGLDAYAAHDRIHAAPFAEHLDNIAAAWAGSHLRGEYTAITTTTNDHVNVINRAVQAHRRTLGQLADQHLDIGDITVHVGDVITTRRNQRLLRTSTGDSVRNRDYWTINSFTADGGLAVTRIDGHGTTTLPADYVTDHVQLGYAATEPGNQSDTATASITLATAATTCRGLYVAVTRGQAENLICVVTDTHDVADAIDVLERILATDRADPPATRIRRELAAATPPAPALKPRCEIPDWFTDLHRHARRELAVARADAAAQQQRERELRERIDQLTGQLAGLEPHCAPHDRAITRSANDLDQARQRQRQAERELAKSGRLHRRTARNTVADAAADVATAHIALDEITRRAQPVLDQRNELRTERGRVQHHITADRQLARSLDRYDHRVLNAQHRVDALDTWADWANGHPPHAPLPSSTPPNTCTTPAATTHSSPNHSPPGSTNTTSHPHSRHVQRSRSCNTRLDQNRPDSTSASDRGGTAPMASSASARADLCTFLGVLRRWFPNLAWHRWLRVAPVAPTGLDSRRSSR